MTVTNNTLGVYVMFSFDGCSAEGRISSSPNYILIMRCLRAAIMLLLFYSITGKGNKFDLYIHL